MLKLDLPFEEQDGATLGEPASDESRLPELRGLVAEPLAGLVALVLAFALIDGTQHVACSTSEGAACGALQPVVLAAISLGTLLAAGFLLKAAFDRYMRRRTQVLAAILAALPLAHLLAGGHNLDAPVASSAPQLEALIEETTTQREALRAELAGLRSRLAVQEAKLVAQENAIASLSPEAFAEIARAEALRVAEEETEAIAAKIDEREDDLLSELVAIERRRDALGAVGARIAARGPVPRPGVPAERLPEDMGRDLAILAEYLGLEDEGRTALARDDELRACINVRKAERGPLAAMNHRLNRERYAAFLAGCVAGSEG
jgi:hypothetical protein